MSEIMQVTKIEAAKRQLNAAIRMLFSEEDPIVVHTLVGAASTIFTDLIRIQAPHKSWDKLAQEANNITPSQYFQIMRKAQNFLKHAQADHGEKLDFNPIDTEALTFWAVMNAGELALLSIEAQVFQLWYIASHSPIGDENQSPFREAFNLFGDLRHCSRMERLKSGAHVLAQETNAG